MKKSKVLLSEPLYKRNLPQGAVNIGSNNRRTVKTVLYVQLLISLLAAPLLAQDTNK